MFNCNERLLLQLQKRNTINSDEESDSEEGAFFNQRDLQRNDLRDERIQKVFRKHVGRALIAYDQNKVLSLQDQRIIHGIRSAHMIGFDHNAKKEQFKEAIREARTPKASQLVPTVPIKKATEQANFESLMDPTKRVDFSSDRLLLSGANSDRRGNSSQR